MTEASLNAVDPGHAVDIEHADCLECKHSKRFPANEHALGCINPKIAVKGCVRTIGILASVVRKYDCKGAWKEKLDDS